MNDGIQVLFGLVFVLIGLCIIAVPTFLETDRRIGKFDIAVARLGIAIVISGLVFMLSVKSALITLAILIILITSAFLPLPRLLQKFFSSVVQFVAAIGDGIMVALGKQP